jgi:hypothetical protein
VPLLSTPRIETLDELVRASEESEVVYLIAPLHHYNNPAYLTEAMREYIEAHYVRIPLSYDTTIRLFQHRVSDEEP